MLSQAVVYLHLKPYEFYDLTPFEFNTMMMTLENKYIDKYNDMISLSWHTAVLDRQKKLQPLKTLIKKPKQKQIKQPISKDELLEIAKKKEVI